MLGVATNGIQGNAVAHASNDFHRAVDVSGLSLSTVKMTFTNSSGELLHEASSCEFSNNECEPSSYSQTTQGAAYPDVEVTDAGASFR
jgi:hypothetical protein